VKRTLSKALALALTLGLSNIAAAPAQSSNLETESVLAQRAFVGTSTSLSSAQKAEIKSILASYALATKFTCTANVHSLASKAEVSRAMARAKATCAHIKKLKRAVVTAVATETSSMRSNSGKVAITITSRLGVNSASPSNAEVCKVPDGLPPNMKGLPRGATVDGKQVRGSIGFPFTSGTFPIMGEANLVAVMVSFEDTKEFVQSPVDFLGPQTKKISDWSRFWSQGKFEYKFQVVPNWIRLPMKSSEATGNDEELARMILERFPAGIDYSDVDGTFIYWAPGLKATGHDFGIRVGSNENPFVVGEKRPGLVWAPSQWHYENSGQLTAAIKRDYTWSYWIHELLHEQNLNLHAPGNGWATGVGQNSYPNPSAKGAFSAALPAWELFLIGWLDDSQVHCISVADLAKTQSVSLTPLEVRGGDRKAIVIPTEIAGELIVVESRRPIGYTENWGTKNQGLLVYRANPLLLEQDDHTSGDCGNDPTYPKWSYYLFPDREKADPNKWCRGFEIALVNKGESVTYNGVKITLSKSTGSSDLVVVSRSTSIARKSSVPIDAVKPSISNHSALPTSWLREQERHGHCYCCGCQPSS
jgi:hypothetical protein